MNVNNIFAGVLGFVMAMALTYLTWDPINSFLNGITTTELQLFLKVVYVCFVFVTCIIIPINLSTSDDSGTN